MTAEFSIFIIVVIAFVILIIVIMIRSMIDDRVKKHEERLNQEYAYKVETFKEYVSDQHEDVKKILSGSAESRTYIAGMMTDYLLLDLYNIERWLGNGKADERRRAIRINEIRLETRALLQEYKTAAYQLDYILSLYPSLKDTIELEYKDIHTTLKVSDDDPTKDYLTTSEYQKLNRDESNQLALDRYLKSHKKTKWQIGRDYEMFIGYELRNKGYQVENFGISERMNDAGRDVIAIKDGIHNIIQCKYWAASKTIHEKHILQLFGTAACYAIEHSLSMEMVIPVFVTNISYSDTARKMAHMLSVKLFANKEIGKYPIIKCKVGRDELGIETHIYHLPMDQQYDVTKIDTSNGDCYAFTVAEAVAKGFRRAYRWYGS